MIEEKLKPVVTISADQSTSHCALTVWYDDKPISKSILMTGSCKSKVKNKDAVYFPIITQQIDYICNKICEAVKSYNADYYVMESPAQGAYGDAKATLLTLFRAINETLIEKTHLKEEDIYSIAPTSVKSFARNFLPEEEQTLLVEKVDKKGKTKIVKNKVKMEKSHMVKVCEILQPNWLDGLTLSQGRADYADSYLIGYQFIKEILKL
jgi:hypothetical protein